MTPNSHPERGLPPVAPPSGRFIAQLFLVPGLIVTVAVFVLLFFSWFVGGESAPDELLKRLADANTDIRWRAANDLAQRLKRDDELASNPQVALRLVELLGQRLRDFDQAQKSFAERSARLSDEERKREREALREKRKDIQFLAPCLGNLILPVGAPVLCDLARRERGADETTLTLLRRQAIWALANLGENLKRFDKLSPERQSAVLKELESEATTGASDTREPAAKASTYLRELHDGKTPASMGVVGTLVQCAGADDPFLRELTALALNFWTGSTAENQVAEQTLVQLAHDRGQGKRIEIGAED